MQKSLFLSVLVFSFSTSAAVAYDGSLANCQPAILENICSAQNVTGEACENAKNAAVAACDQLSSFSVWLHGIWTKLQPALTNGVVTVLGALIALVFAVLSARLNRRMQEIERSNRELSAVNQNLEAVNGRLSSRLGDPLLEQIPEVEARAVNVLFVGIGGSGKTSLVHAISASANARPSVATASNHLYSVAHEVNIDSVKSVPHRELVRFYLSDHVGQNFSSVGSTDFFTNDALARLPKALVVVVDIDEPQPIGAAREVTQETIEARAQKHVDAYSDQLVQVLTGKLGENATIVLFINKLDVLEPFSAADQESVVNLFNDLARKFSRIRGAEFKLVLGSANNGLGINACTIQSGGVILPNLYQSLRSSSVKIQG